jgi:light-harvesting complex I chlorophyll a/b binding protein 1
LERYREAELIHGRWAMMGVAGVIGVEVAGQGTWVTAQPTSWEQTAKYMGMETHANLFAVIGTNLLLVAFAESSRGAAKGTDRMYPGGKFDPLGWSKGAEFETLKRKEIANGRVAMLAFLGVMSENQACPGLGPVEALKEHIASPWTVSAATNANAVPFL